HGIANLDAELGVLRDLCAGGERRNVDELGLLAVGGWPVIVAAGRGRAHLLGLRARHRRGSPGIDLDILARVVIDRLASLRIDALGPVDVLEVGLDHEGLPVAALHGVEEAVARRVRDQLAVLAGDLAVDQNVRARLVIVPRVVRRVLEEPVHLAVVGIPGDHAVGVEIVAGPIVGVEHRHRVAGAPDHLVVGDVVAAGDPHGAAAGLPGLLILVLPGLAAGLARLRDDVFLPEELASLGIEPGDPVAYAAVAAGRAHDHLVLHNQRCRGELHVGLVGEIGLPDHLAGVLVGRDHARRIVRGRDDQVAPQRRATVGEREALLLGVHAPDDAAGVTGAHVDLVDDAP